MVEYGGLCVMISETQKKLMWSVDNWGMEVLQGL